jgi:hypothetical protein
VAVDSSGWPAMAPDRHAWAACVGDAGDGVSVADGWDRGEAGPGGSGRGTREKGESGTGHQWDADMRARVAQCLAVWFKPDLKQKSEFKWFKTFSNCFKF